MFDEEKLNSIQASIPEKLELRTIGDLTPGGNCVVTAGALWVDDEGKCWLDTTHPVDVDRDESFTYIHVICFYEGLVVDIVSGDYNKPPSFSRAQSKLSDDELRLDALNYSPVVWFVASTHDLSKLTSYYQSQYGYPLFVNKNGNTAHEGKSDIGEKLAATESRASKLARILKVRPGRSAL